MAESSTPESAYALTAILTRASCLLLNRNQHHLSNSKKKSGSHHLRIGRQSRSSLLRRASVFCFIFISALFTATYIGQFSLQKDEWCVTYCSQSVTGRIHGKEPFCRSLCVRKVFPHEVKNILAFKRHKALDSNGKAIYPLPAEGQAANLPRMLGGRPPEDPEDSNYKHRAPEPPKSWDEGLYLWTGKGRLAAHEKMDSMSMDFERQRRVAAMREKRREVWQDYENTIRQQKSNDASTQDRIWVPNIPPRPLPDTRSV